MEAVYGLLPDDFCNAEVHLLVGVVFLWVQLLSFRGKAVEGLEHLVDVGVLFGGNVDDAAGFQLGEGGGQEGAHQSHSGVGGVYLVDSYHRLAEVGCHQGGGELLLLARGAGGVDDVEDGICTVQLLGGNSLEPQVQLFFRVMVAGSVHKNQLS